jgi:hypothetical protein
MTFSSMEVFLLFPSHNFPITIFAKSQKQSYFCFIRFIFTMASQLTVGRRKRMTSTRRNRIRRQRQAQETEQERLLRRENRNLRDRARRASMATSGQERQEEHERNVESVQTAWDITPEEFFQELEEKKEAFLDKMIEHDPFKAVVMWYLNSGTARYEGLSEFDPSRSTWTDEDVQKHFDKIQKEIYEQVMTDEELDEMIQSYLWRRNPGNNRDLLSCGACGIRKQDVEDSCGMYHERDASSLLAPVDP